MCALTKAQTALPYQNRLGFLTERGDTEPKVVVPTGKKIGGSVEPKSSQAQANQLHVQLAW